MDNYITVRQAVRFYISMTNKKIGDRYIRKLFMQGKIRAEKKEGKWFTTYDDMKNFINSK